MTIKIGFNQKILILFLILSSLVFGDSKEIVKEWTQGKVDYGISSDEDIIVVIVDGMRYLLILNPEYPNFWYISISEYKLKNNKYDFTDIYAATKYESIGEIRGSSAFYVDKKIAVKYVDGEKIEVDFDETVNFFIEKIHPYIQAINTIGFNKEELEYYKKLLEKYNQFVEENKK